ncbi:isoleucine--tRNA ligase [Paludicola sp. MB14-C6]|uniref:isoleucine--tRNA ligase n=1 Tax=Paludihabitans sp. MB14-C6 TaxID=3070656 RepID=UPI0027DDC1AF|nr:isoleucine--tRNA ligase [Paludicola sp. MB14-C6]WMJ23114.1 isoleucine--tRNA ligase [Paludicola sp. MB14-C6]
MAQDYNNTLNLPQSEFPMRGNLPKREPGMLAEFEKNELYYKLMEKNEGKPLYVLHDGPPYANGDIHLGHVLNKVLKDIVVKHKNMTGFKAPYVPGWDTHGLPIELKALKKDGVDPTSIDAISLRKICQEFAQSFVENQKNQFKRLGVIADYNNPYLTLKPEFEAKQVEIFGAMAKKNFIYKGLKPVYWCSGCGTALAEAEIEYAEDKCNSIYVKFNVVDDKGIFEKLGIDKKDVYFVIWTTTTWTLPGNVAICLGPDYEYTLVKVNNEYLVMAKDLVASTMKAAKIEEFETVGSFKGSELEYMKTQHPFLDRQSLVIYGDHVTLESGTGCVHTAPGHGVEDFEVCKNYKELPIVVPVDSKGKLTSEAGEFAGLTTDAANKAIAKKLEETNNLFALEKINHQYPHCWRCKDPILFRATEQWFCSIDGFKEDALKEISKVKWIPAWGEKRIESMVKDRSDWCISRQRTWGVPIPILYCKDCNKPVVNDESIKAISELFRKEGSNAWYIKNPSEFLPANFKCECGCNEFTKESDIMDVWFDSGVSHAAVCDERDYLQWPADLYLEGADQYRGWFQSSLLTSVAWRGVAPYKAVCTHGMVVDGEGKKQSKSLGNGIAPEEIIKQYGADILRLWVASSDYHSDIRISSDILKQLSEAYRKIRNTAKYILGNLYDFKPDTDMVEMSKLTDLDKLALYKLNGLVEKVNTAYENLDFHVVFHAIHNFCVVDMSSFYLDIIKDRLYCDAANGDRRRSAQTTMYIVLDALTRMIAPILAFTSEEIWSFMPHKKADDAGSVLFNEMYRSIDVKVDNTFVENWDTIYNVRNDVQKALEIKRTENVIGKSLEAKVTLYCDGTLADLLNSMSEDLAEIFICSQVHIENGKGNFAGDMEGLSVTVESATGEKCERCWIYSDTVGCDSEHPTLCKRCAEVMK